MSGISMAGLRRWLPLVVVVLTAFSLLVMGFACICAADHHSGQAIERTIGSIPVVAVPLPVVGTWIAVLLLLPAAAARLERRRFGFGRASPAVLQRFLI